VIEERYVVRDCPFCDGGRDLLPSAGAGPSTASAGGATGAGSLVPLSIPSQRAGAPRFRRLPYAPPV
jgi:hypothetical protein